MNEMIERVARAIYESSSPTIHWDDTRLNVQEAWRRHARAAIVAMREPTDGMINAGVEARKKLFDGFSPEKRRTILVADHPAGTIFVAMITAALEN